MRRYRLPLLVTLLTYLVIITISTITTEPTTPIQAVQPAQTTQTVQIPTYEKPTPQRLLELTNAERVKAGVKPLIMDERLNKSAQMKADELVREGWDDTPHVSDSGVRGVTYIMDYMPSCYVKSENLAENYELNPILGFKPSKPHWDAVLNSSFDYVGFGVTDKYLAVHFCSID